MAQSFLLTNLKYGEDNRLSVRLDTRESLNQPPFGFLIDYLCYGGLYREARLEVTEPCHIRSVFPTAHADGSAKVRVELSQAPAVGDTLRLTLPELGIDLTLDAQAENEFTFQAENFSPVAGALAVTVTLSPTLYVPLPLPPFTFTVCELMV